MAIILPTGQWYAPSAVINDAWYCMVLHGIGLYCIVLDGIAWYFLSNVYLAFKRTSLSTGIRDDKKENRFVSVGLTLWSLH